MSGPLAAPARVLLAAESLRAGNGGICRVARLMGRVLAEEVAAGRCRADALSLNDPPDAADPALGIPARPVGGSRLAFVARARAATLNHSHVIYDFAGLARAHGRWPRRRPYLAYVHGIEAWEQARADHLRALRGAAMLLCNSAYTRERALCTHGDLGDPRVCWLATEREDEPAPLTPAEASGPPTILMVARLHEPEKGHPELIDAFPRVLEAVPDARLVLVGTGPSADALKRRAAASPAAGRVEFTGFVSDEELERRWRTAAVFAMPSRCEGFGLTYIEAMRQGLPVIATVHDAAPEVNLDGRTGFNVDLGRPADLPDRLIQLLRDRDLAARLGAAGRQRWRDHFRYSAFHARFLPHLRAFLAT